MVDDEDELLLGEESAVPDLAFPDPDPSATLSMRRRAALGFVREFPSRHRGQTHNVFGGLPTAPTSFEWPRRGDARGRGVPFTFLAQIDCAELPDFADRALLPQSGALYAFADFERGQPAILHLPGPAADWIAHAPPADTPPILGRWGRDALPWIGYAEDASRRMPRSFPRWPVRLGAIDTWDPQSPYDDPVSRDAYQLLRHDRRVEDLTRAFGSPVAQRALAPERAPKTGPAWRPYDGFPQNWRTLDWAAGAMMLETGRLAAKGDPAWARDVAEAHDWQVRARSRDALAPPDALARTAFWTWLDDIALRKPASRDRDAHPARVVARALETVASLAAEVSLAQSPEVAATIPVRTVDALMARHHPLIRAPSGAVSIGLDHQLLGHPSGERRTSGLRLLLQLVRDPAMLWLFGDATAMRFWIEEDDLRKGRFDRVHLTFDRA